MTDPYARQKRYSARLRDERTRMIEALSLIRAELADSVTEKGKRLHDLADSALPGSKER